MCQSASFSEVCSVCCPTRLFLKLIELSGTSYYLNISSAFATRQIFYLCCAWLSCLAQRVGGVWKQSQRLEVENSTVLPGQRTSLDPPECVYLMGLCAMPTIWVGEAIVHLFANKFMTTYTGYFFPAPLYPCN